MSKKLDISRFDIELFKEVELNTNLKEIGNPKMSAYLKADNGMSSWICHFTSKEELLEFINPEVFVENLNEVLSEDELNIFVDGALCCNVPYHFDDKTYYIK